MSWGEGSTGSSSLSKVYVVEGVPMPEVNGRYVPEDHEAAKDVTECLESEEVEVLDAPVPEAKVRKSRAKNLIERAVLWED